MLFGGVTSSPIGKLSLIASDEGLVALDFSAKLPTSLHGLNVSHDPRHRVVRTSVKQLDEYFAGRRQKFDVPLHLIGTDFQLAVWRVLTAIQFGETISYAQEAASMGRRSAVRAVGSANGRNPVAIVVPCHRVIASDGTLGGYSAGLAKKKWLLTHEQSVLDTMVARPRAGSR